MNRKPYRESKLTEYHDDIIKLQEFMYVHNGYIRACVDHGSICSQSAQILYGLYPRHRVLATFICEHRLRYSEGTGISAKQMFCSESISLVQPKTGKKRSLDNKFRVRYFRGFANWEHFTIFPSSYVALKADIKANTPVEMKEWSLEFKDCTHIFRHIWATNQFHQKVSLELIGDGLGHAHGDSVSSYLHPHVPGALNLY